MKKACWILETSGMPCFLINCVNKYHLGAPLHIEKKLQFSKQIKQGCYIIAKLAYPHLYLNCVNFHTLHPNKYELFTTRVDQNKHMYLNMKGPYLYFFHI